MIDDVRRGFDSPPGSQVRQNIVSKIEQELTLLFFNRIFKTLLIDDSHSADRSTERNNL
jgi:hypothetical protein